MAFQNRFENYPILCWTIDDWEQFYSAIKEEDPSFNVNQYVNDYNESSFKNINSLFESAPFKLNLGGKTEKSKLIATDKPMGIFDFSLASRGMYKVPEYFSEKLATEYPEKFKDFELPSGVVPPNLVQQRIEKGENIFFYEDNGEIFDCIIRQKGQTAIDDGVQGAKLKYATKNRKVYLTHKRNKGKVKYVEIYSLFYYTSLNNDTQFAVRHIPAIMVAEYLESIGVMTRIYMTRFVELKNDWELKKETNEGVELPMYKMAKNINFRNSLLVQPIIAKEFGQDFDKALGFMVSSDNFRRAYNTLATWAVKKEIVDQNIDYSQVYGNPNWGRTQYYEGIERFRNKYQEYVELGLFKSKEVLPEAMMFFHDMVIKTRFEDFMYELKSFKASLGFGNTYPDDSQYLVNQNVNAFFNWWMRLSATTLKNKIDIVNSKELRKDLTAIQNEIYSFVTELDNIVKNTNKNLINNQRKNLADYFKEIGRKILEPIDTNGNPQPEYESYWKFGYDILKKNGEFSFKKYITNITAEITTYAEGLYFETDQDRQEVRNDLLNNVLEELKNF